MSIKIGILAAFLALGLYGNAFAGNGLRYYYTLTCPGFPSVHVSTRGIAEDIVNNHKAEAKKKKKNIQCRITRLKYETNEDNKGR